MNEKYGIDLEVITKDLNAKIDEVISKFNALGTQAKQKIVINTDYGSVKNTETRLNQLTELAEYDAEQIKFSLNNPWADPSWTERAKTELNQITTEVNNLSSSISNIDKADNVGKLSNKFNKLTSNIEKGLKKSTSKVKRFGLSLLSIRSLYLLISRASSNYLSQDTELANKLQAVWIGLGSLLTPIIERMANFLIKAVSYINVFVKALTGVDLLAKATSKSLNKVGSSAKSATKQLAGFDEITNIADSSSSLSSGTASDWISAFEDVELNLDWIEKIENFATWLKDKIEKFKNWFEDNKDVVKAGLIVLGTALATLKLNALAAGTAIMSTLFPALLAVATTFLVVLAIKGVSNAIKEVNSLKTEMKNLKNITEETNDSWIENSKAMQDNAEQGKLTEEQLGNYVDTLLYTIDSNDDMIDGLEDQNKWALILSGTYDKTQDTIASMNDENDVMLDRLDKLYDAGKLTTSQAKEYLQKLYDTRSEVDKNSNAYETLTNKIKKVSDAIGDITSQDLSAEVEITADTSGAKSTLKSFFSKMGSSLFNIMFPSLSWTSVLKKIASLDTGTNYVPNDQLAMIHKGEAIIPKKFNNDTYFNNDNSELLKEIKNLNETLENKEFSASISYKEVGKASTKYVNETNRIMGTSVIKQ